MVIDKHATSLIASVQRGLEVCAAFRASPTGVAFPGPFASSSDSSASEEAAAIYQPALYRYFESTLMGALKPVVTPAAAAPTPAPSSHAIVGLAGIQRLWTETKSQKLSIPVALLCVDEQSDAADPSHAAPSSAAADDGSGSSYRSKSWYRNVIGDDLAKIKSGDAALVRQLAPLFFISFLRSCLCRPRNSLSHFLLSPYFLYFHRYCPSQKWNPSTSSLELVDLIVPKPL